MNGSMMRTRFTNPTPVCIMYIFAKGELAVAGRWLCLISTHNRHLIELRIIIKQNTPHGPTAQEDGNLLWEGGKTCSLIACSSLVYDRQFPFQANTQTPLNL